MALVAEADFRSDQSERLIGSADQSFCPFDSPLHPSVQHRAAVICRLMENGEAMHSTEYSQYLSLTIN